MKLNPKLTRNIFLNFPSILKPGTSTIAIKLMLAGIKHAIKSVEIITTILATFWSRLVIEKTLDGVVAFIRHFVFLLRLITNVIVEKKTVTNAEKLMKMLFTAEEIFSTFSRSSVKTKPMSVLFLSGKYFMA